MKAIPSNSGVVRRSDLGANKNVHAQRFFANWFSLNENSLQSGISSEQRLFIAHTRL
jgi:hypothetical protein